MTPHQIFHSRQKLQLRIPRNDLTTVKGVITHEGNLPTAEKTYTLNQYTEVKYNQWFLTLVELPGVEFSQNIFRAARRPRITTNQNARVYC